MFHSSIIQIPPVKPLLVFSFSPNSLFFCCHSNRWTLWFLHWLMWLVITAPAADTSGSCVRTPTCHEHKLLSWRFISSAAHNDLVYQKLQPQGLSVYQLLLPSPNFYSYFLPAWHLVFICQLHKHRLIRSMQGLGKDISKQQWLLQGALGKICLTWGAAAIWDNGFSVL